MRRRKRQPAMLGLAEDVNMEEVLGKGVRKVETAVAESDLEVESR